MHDFFHSFVDGHGVLPLAADVSHGELPPQARHQVVLLDRLIGSETELIGEIQQSGMALNQFSDFVGTFLKELKAI
jgi:hypothetical protein